MLVLKLGGSLAESGHLATLLDLVVVATVPVVVVPGGGAFADAVRDCQSKYNYTDPVAHRLALLAMHQMGLMMSAHSQRLRGVSTLDAIRETAANGLLPVWMPYALQHHDDTLPADWTVTSDSLAARLAERLGDATVVLVKSCTVAPGASLESLTAAGIVDPNFAQVVVRAGLPWRIYGPGDEPLLERALHHKGAPSASQMH